ncbi:MAG: hypothetical protein ACRDTA_00460, partial [Pseudonocardiaceae bacterium]
MFNVGDGDGPYTRPSSPADPDAVPGGTRTTIPPNAGPVQVRSLNRENDSAEILARAGYDVEQNPSVPGDKEPDYRIEGLIFDNYAPTTGNVRNIADRIE